MTSEARPRGARVEELVQVPSHDVRLEGSLTIPPDARGLVLFAHGSGSSRHSPRNRFVASLLNDGGLATLLMDLLTTDEEEIDLRTRHLRFNIEMLAGRLVDAVDWLDEQAETGHLPIGTFGSSTGAAAALIAAARRPRRVHAVVSRGGRPDLAEESLALVEAPTLLIVGGRDEVVIDLNERAMAQMEADEVELEIVQGATHLFEEPGALEEVARLARAWFTQHL